MGHLSSKTELSDQCSVSFDILFLQVFEQASSCTDHLQQPAAGMMVLLMRLQMLIQVIDARRQQCDLHFRRTGIALMRCLVRHNCALVDFFHVNCLPKIEIAENSVLRRVFAKRSIRFDTNALYHILFFL